jgi:hypothetical protein
MTIIPSGSGGDPAAYLVQRPAFDSASSWER